MMPFFQPKQPTFFALFRTLAEKQTEMAELFAEFAAHFGEAEQYAKRAKEVEHAADEITHAIVEQLNLTFVTPLDREDIYAVAHKLDDIIDIVENTINNIRLYHIERKRSELDTFAQLIVRASKHTAELVSHLEARKSTPAMRELVVSLHTLEDEGDDVFQRAIEKLFAESKDAVAIIKWKDIFENLEGVLDTYQQLSDSIEGVLVKAS